MIKRTLTALLLALVWLLPAPALAGDRLSRGRQLFASGHARQAVAVYDDILLSQPGDVFARFDLAFALASLGRNRQALQQVEAVLARIPPSTWVLTWMRRSPTPFHLLQVQPANLFLARALTLEGRLLIEQHPRRAMNSLEQALEAAPASYLRPLLELARAAAAAGERGVAAHYFEDYLQRSLRRTGSACDLALWGPGSLAGGRAWLTYSVSPRGRMRTMGGLDLGIALPPQSYGLTVDQLGVVRVNRLAGPKPVTVGLLKVPSGSRLLSGYSIDEPGTDRVWKEFTQLCPRAARLVREAPFESRTRLRAQLRKLTTDPRLAYFAQVRLGELDTADFFGGAGARALSGAQAHYARALSLDSDVDLSDYDMASVRLLAGADNDAMRYLDRVLRKHPGRRAPRRYRIRLLVQRGLLSQALREAAAYTHGFPDDPYPRFATAEILALQGRNGAALTAVRGLLGRNPGLIEARYLEVFLLARQGQFEQEIAELDRLLQADPFPFRAERLLASILERVGKPKRADRLYRAYLRSPAAQYFEPVEYFHVYASHRAFAR